MSEYDIILLGNLYMFETFYYFCCFYSALYISLRLSVVLLLREQLDDETIQEGKQVCFTKQVGIFLTT